MTTRDVHLQARKSPRDHLHVAPKPDSSKSPSEKGEMPLPSNSYQWELEYTAPGGRRYFLDRTSGRYAAADMSGEYPEDTDDGVLWIAYDLPIRVGDQYCLIPVRDERGCTNVMPASPAEMLEVASRLHMAILDEHGMRRYLVSSPAPAESLAYWN